MEDVPLALVWWMCVIFGVRLREWVNFECCEKKLIVCQVSSCDGALQKVLEKP